MLRADAAYIKIKKLELINAEYYDLYCELLFSPFEPPSNLEAHNLLQQAKALNDFACNGQLTKRGLNLKAIKLINQAKELKGQQYEL